MATGFEVTQSLLGPSGGQLAIAFGAGCAAGYAFCIRTVYKLLGNHSDSRHNDCMKRIEELASENKKLNDRIVTLEERLYMGSNRQLAQVHESSVKLLDEGQVRDVTPKLKRDD